MGGPRPGARGVSVRSVAETAQALADLTEISAQIEMAVVFDLEGTVLAATVDDERAGKLAGSALELLRAAEEHRAEPGEELAQLDVVLQGGSVFLVRDGDRLIAATTAPEPTVGLVFYDLKSCLRGLGQDEKPKRSPAKKSTTRSRKKDDEES
jgi:predicted regulator of Ras-like GTPase activity (Roadblock/LC7/MglB family)